IQGHLYILWLPLGLGLVAAPKLDFMAVTVSRPASTDRLLTLHFCRPSELSTSDGRCQLSGSRFRLLEFRYVVETSRCLTTDEGQHCF
ncbi:MAG: hypothetical protein U1A73_00905, partial [Pseudomonas sp.]|nr:hypothetical protein [Pseudomonas sp.]